MMQGFLGWIWILMVSLATTEHVTPPFELAESIAYAAQESPLPGEHGVSRMAAVLVSIAWNESRFDLFALGDCGDPKHRTPATCASHGPFQINKGWARPPRGGEAALAARLVLESFRVCSARPLDERLAWYAAGGAGCQDAGLRASRWRMAQAKSLLHAHPFGVE